MNTHAITFIVPRILIDMRLIISEDMPISTDLGIMEFPGMDGMKNIRDIVAEGINDTTDMDIGFDMRTIDIITYIVMEDRGHGVVGG